MKKKILSFLLSASLLAAAVVPASPITAQGANPLSSSGAAVDEDKDGLAVGKMATAHDDGSYTITMEAFTTGEVKTEVKDVPLDIVLVLDQSGSMAYNFNGDSTSTNSERRQYAMKQAVNNFIDQVAGKYDAEKADHRISIVTFGSNASVLQSWTDVDSSGETTLQNKINELPERPSGATNAGAGMQQAVSLINSAGSAEGRSQVVIMFTDGVPTTNSDFDIGVANTAITNAKTLKDQGVSIYSVGIFTGANPQQLHGDIDHRLVSSVVCTGEVGSIWNSELGVNWFGDITEQDVPAGNRFLNFLSSNFENATEIGIVNHNRQFIGIGYFGYQITKNFDRDSSDYYLTADNADALNKVFEQISDSISTPTISLDASTVIKDVVTPYFNVPNAQDVKVYTADATSTSLTNNEWAERQEISNAQVSVSDDTISVTGFDFNKNFVSSEQKPETKDYGKKLIIEFTVTPKDGFLGGNNVPTNGTTSGVYTGETAVDTFEVPQVNVPIEDVTVTAQDKNVYLLGSLSQENVLDGATAQVGDVELQLGEDGYGLDSWQYEFVNITPTINVQDYNNLTKDEDYSLAVTVSPTTNGANASGTPATSTSSSPCTAKINVFKPEITWQDSQINAGETADYNDNFVSAEWKHGNQVASSVTMIGTAPELIYEYTPEAGAFTQETPVKVTVKIGGQEINQYINVLHADNCTFPDCKWDEVYKNQDCHFVVHIKSFDLTIEKTGCEAIDENQSFVFSVTGPNGYSTQVVIPGNGSVTIKGLPVGEYTITEDTSWSWRYEPEDGVAQTVTVDDVENGTATVIFNNTRDHEQWLDGNAYEWNLFDGSND